MLPKAKEVTDEAHVEESRIERPGPVCTITELEILAENICDAVAEAILRTAAIPRSKKRFFLYTLTPPPRIGGWL